MGASGVCAECGSVNSSLYLIPVLFPKCWRCLPLPRCPRVSPWMCLLLFLVQKKSDSNSANSLSTRPNLEHHPSFLPSPPQPVISQPSVFCPLHLSALLPLLPVPKGSPRPGVPPGDASGATRRPRGQPTLGGWRSCQDRGVPEREAGRVV